MKHSLLFLTLLFSSAANAAFYTAGDIQKGIISYDRVNQMRTVQADVQESAVMLGYIASVADQASVEGLTCLPRAATIGQLVAVTRNYLNAHPNVWDVSGTVVIRLALIDAFPCKK